MGASQLGVLFVSISEPKGIIERLMVLIGNMLELYLLFNMVISPSTPKMLGLDS